MFMYFYNKSSQNYQIKGKTAHENILSLTNYSGEEGFVLPPLGENVLIGNRIEFYASYQFWVAYSLIPVGKANLYSKNKSKLDQLFFLKKAPKIYYDFIYNNLKFDLKDILNDMDTTQIIHDTVINNNPKEMNELLALTPINDGVVVKFREKYTYPSSGYYIGEWKFDKFYYHHGRGKYVWESAGITYVGYWKNQKQHGKGTETYKDGSYMVIDFVDGKRHGEGILTSNNSTISRLQYNNGTFVKYI